MNNPAFTKALIRLLLSIPLLVLLFGSAVLPTILSWSRLYAPNWNETFSVLTENASLIESITAFLLMCLQYPLYLYGFENLRRRLPGANTLLAVSTLSSFFLGILPLFFSEFSSFFLSTPLYDSTMSALLAFDAVSKDFPSYFHLIGFWTFSFSLSEVLRARAAILLTRAASEPPIPENSIALELSPISNHAALLSLLFVILSGLAWSLLGVSVPFTIAFCLYFILTIAPFTLPLAESIPLWIGAALLEEQGISLRSLRTIEAASSVDVLVLGKSDILTEGEPRITDLVPEGITMTAFMSLAAAAESGSRHPIAKIISEHAIRLRAKYGRIAAFNESPGEGVEVLMNGAPIRVGQKAWIESQGVRISANLLTKDDQLAEKGKTILYVSNGKNAKGIIAYEYDLNAETAQVVRTLEKQGIETILMISESARTAKSVAKRLGVPNYWHSIRSTDLVREIQLLQAHGKNVSLFANLSEDHPAIRQADCPILPRFENNNETTDSESKTIAATAVIDAAPLSMEEIRNPSQHCLPALIIKDLTALPIARSIVKEIRFVIRQNTLAAFLGTILILPVSSGIFVTMGGSFPAPWHASLAALPGLLAIIANAIRMGREFLALQSVKTESMKEGKSA